MTKGTPGRPQTGAARRASKAQHRASKLPPDVEATGGLLSLNAAAHYLDVSRWTLYRLIEEGEFGTLNVKSLRRVRRADLDAYINRQAQAS